MSWDLPQTAQSYTFRDSILYAIGIGASIDGIDSRELPFLYERFGPLTFPTMATVIGQRAQWMDDRALGIDCSRIVHGEQALTSHVPLPPEASIVSDEKVAGIYDKGEGKGALVQMERTLRDAANGTLYSTLLSTYFLRGDGGCGGPPQPAQPKVDFPDRPADAAISLATRPDQTIIYRLSGDYVLLHIDRSFAERVGFAGPIIHGLCSYGMAARAIIIALCDLDPTRLESVSVRFSAPAYPGETIHVEMWHGEGRQVLFRASAVERNVVILNNGVAMLRPSAA
jgi:acyl dehydratase